MKVGLVTREYPPEVYGGAGVHVEYLVRELRRLDAVERLAVHCFGAPRAEPDVHAYPTPPALAAANPALQTAGVDVEIAGALGDVDLVHTHTWYANLAGHLAARLHGIPHVLTTHSLEPDRPWKAEQLGGGYALSSWCERVSIEAADLVVAVSEGMRRDVLRAYPAVAPERVAVVHNGIDTVEYAPPPADVVAQVLARHGVDPDRPSVIFVGRITRQKGVPDLLRAASSFHPDAQLVLCAGAPDTPELGAEVRGLVEGLAASRSGVLWIPSMLPRPEVVALLAAATVFVCPSVYEPLGIVNLEAMACGTAVVATAVGGIPEVVDDGRTGLLVAPGEGVEHRLADAVNALLRDPSRAAAMGAAGRARAETAFSWSAIAERTAELYTGLLPPSARAG